MRAHSLVLFPSLSPFAFPSNLKLMVARAGFARGTSGIFPPSVGGGKCLRLKRGHEEKGRREKHARRWESRRSLRFRQEKIWKPGIPPVPRAIASIRSQRKKRLTDKRYLGTARLRLSPSIPPNQLETPYYARPYFIVAPLDSPEINEINSTFRLVGSRGARGDGISVGYIIQRIAEIFFGAPRIPPVSTITCPFILKSAFPVTSRVHVEQRRTRGGGKERKDINPENDYRVYSSF